MEVSVLNINGQETGRKVALNDAIFGIESSDARKAAAALVVVTSTHRCSRVVAAFSVLSPVTMVLSSTRK